MRVQCGAECTKREQSACASAREERGKSACTKRAHRRCEGRWMRIGRRTIGAIANRTWCGRSRGRRTRSRPSPPRPLCGRPQAAWTLASEGMLAGGFAQLPTKARAQRLPVCPLAFAQAASRRHASRARRSPPPQSALAGLLLSLPRERSLCHVSGRCQFAPQPTTQDVASATPHGNDSGGHHGPALSSPATSGFRLRCSAHRRDRGWERRAAHRSLHRRRPPPRSNAHTTHESASPNSRLLEAVAP